MINKINKIIEYAKSPKFSEDSESKDYLSDGQMLDIVLDKLQELTKTDEHEDKDIVDVLARDFPQVYEQILEYLDEL